MGSMLLDHLGALFWPHVLVLRVIGRLALPLYTFAMVQAFRHSHDRRQYALRLGVIAAVTQPVFAATFGHAHWNMVWSLLASFGVLCALDTAPRWAEQLRPAGTTAGTFTAGLRVLIVGAALAAFTVLPLDYGVYGLGLALLYACAPALAGLVAGHVALNLLAGMLGYWWQLQMWSAVATLLVVLRSYPPLHYGRWAYRMFYPAHLVILAAVLWLRAAG